MQSEDSEAPIDVASLEYVQSLWKQIVGRKKNCEKI